MSRPAEFGPRVQLKVRVPAEERDAVREAARRQGLSMRAIVAGYIAAGVARDDKAAR